MKVSDMTNFNIDFKESLVHFSIKRRKILQFKVCTILVRLTDSGSTYCSTKKTLRLAHIILKSEAILALVNQDALS